MFVCEFLHNFHLKMIINIITNKATYPFRLVENRCELNHLDKLI